MLHIQGCLKSPAFQSKTAALFDWEPDYKTSQLQGLKISTETALEKLRQIKAGEVVLNSARSPVITALDDEHKAIYRQLEIYFPKIRQL